MEKAAELGCGALCFEGNIDFYGKSGFRQASEYGIRYHGLPEGEDASFFLCKELVPGYLNGIKNHMLHGVFMEMERKHYPDEMVEAIRDTLDCNPVFHGNVVSVNQMIGIMMGSIAVFGIIYYFVTLLPDGEGGR